MNKGYNFVCAETSQQIHPKYLKSLNYFMEQCISLLREFGVEVSNVINKSTEINRIKVSYKISDKHTNLIHYFDNIGYRYAFTKNSESFKIVEYLRYKSILFNNHLKFIEKGEENEKKIEEFSLLLSFI